MEQYIVNAVLMKMISLQPYLTVSYANVNNSFSSLLGIPIVTCNINKDLSISISLNSCNIFVLL